MLCSVAIMDRDTHSTVTVVNLVSFSRDNIRHELGKLRELRESGMIYGKVNRIECTKLGTYFLGVY